MSKEAIPQIDEAFHSYSHIVTSAEKIDEYGKPQDDTNMRDLSQQNTFQAAMEILRDKDAPLSDEEETDMKNTYFNSVWNQYADKKTGTMALSDAGDFMRTFVSEASEPQKQTYENDEQINQKMIDNWG